ncbi:HlyD family secretion protein [Terrihabitans sp. B22-R8]|uniref:HlyD family secretion protein n=1 Tax=Terrihabitans sp. B22-R8 TaxID=3425128 RepID=UPI00403CFC9A
MDARVAKTNELEPNAPQIPEAQSTEKQDAGPAEKLPAHKGGRTRLILLAVAVLALGVGGYFGYGYWTEGRFMVSTDDAYVQADVTTLVAKASGYVSKIHVRDNAQVKAGDLLAEIDAGDYQLAAQAARDKIAAQEASIGRINAQIPASEAAVAQAQAQIVSAEATRVRAQSDFDRAEALAARDFGSRQALDTARANRDNALASLESAKAGLAQARANVDVTKAQLTEAQASLNGLRTELASAERDLSFTQIHAPADGVVGNRAIDVGSYVTTGTRMMALVPTSTVYVAANFKETQLAEIVPGQEVSLSVDAIEKIEIRGRVESIAPASGSVFSLLPVENATGNFTKIVQRVPVRIALDADEAVRAHLRPGLSVVVDVDTRTAPPATHTAER